MPFHKGIHGFNYDQAVDWAIDLLERGEQNDHILMLASFQKPVDTVEIKPYITLALESLQINEYTEELALLGYIHFYVSRILENVGIRDQLKVLYQIYRDQAVDSLLPFYLLYWGWCDIEEVGENNYYEGATIDNIQEKVLFEAQNWIDKHQKILDNI